MEQSTYTGAPDECSKHWPTKLVKDRCIDCLDEAVTDALAHLEHLEETISPLVESLGFERGSHVILHLGLAKRALGGF